MSQTQLPLGQSIRVLLGSSRAYWIVNLANFGDGIAYFGILTFLGTYLGHDEGLGRLGLSDPAAHLSVSFYTGLVTLFMLNGGKISDQMGVRRAITWSLATCAVGRTLLAAAPSLGLGQLGCQFAAWIALAIMAFGTGVLQPALFAGVKEYTDERTSSVGWSLLYAIMNVGIVVAELLSPFLRTRAEYHFFGTTIHGLGLGIQGIFWILTGLTVVLWLANLTLFTEGIEERERVSPAPPNGGSMRGFWWWLAFSAGAGVVLGAIVHDTEVHPHFWKFGLPVLIISLLACLFVYLRNLEPRFAFFIFILVPVRMLFAHQWLTLPGYVFRCFDQVVKDHFEWINVINPAIVAILTPIIAIFTVRMKVIDIMILGTAISAGVTFVLVPAPNLYLLLFYLTVFSIGEAIWAARFFEYVSSLARPGETGAYMGVANLPWFVAKLVTGTFSGTLLARYIPEHGAQQPGELWLLYGVIAVISPIGLIVARRWILSVEGRSPAAPSGNTDGD